MEYLALIFSILFHPPAMKIRGTANESAIEKGMNLPLAGIK
jgi:hypothetical protein